MTLKFTTVHDDDSWYVGCVWLVIRHVLSDYNKVHLGLSKETKKVSLV